MIEVDAANAAPEDISLQILGELSAAGIIAKIDFSCVEQGRA
jgi:hypothetical protein